jgi:two-component sensor histidine kinase
MTVAEAALAMGKNKANRFGELRIGIATVFSHRLALNGVSFVVLSVFLSLIHICIRKRQAYKATREKEEYIGQLQSAIEHLEDNIVSLSSKNEWLTTEMHHRVKNNLQILNSLINSQLYFVKDKMGRDALFNNRNRMFALSLVHQKMFQSANETTIEMACCIKELADYLADQFQIDGRIKFEINLIPLQLDIAGAIPFALIINELVSNTMKFAFPDYKKGVVKISLSSEDNLYYRLVFSDNGVGLPKDVDFNSSGSLGRSLIIGLSKQIRGSIQVNNKKGLEIIMDFMASQGQQSRFAV